jgi:hypothetical protein
MMFRDLSIMRILLESGEANNRKSPSLSPHILDAPLKEADKGLPPSPVSS